MRFVVQNPKLLLFFPYEIPPLFDDTWMTISVTAFFKFYIKML